MFLLTNRGKKSGYLKAIDGDNEIVLVARRINMGESAQAKLKLEIGNVRADFATYAARAYAYM